MNYVYTHKNGNGHGHVKGVTVERVKPGKKAKAEKREQIAAGTPRNQLTRREARAVEDFLTEILTRSESGKYRYAGQWTDELVASELSGQFHVTGNNVAGIRKALFGMLERGPAKSTKQKAPLRGRVTVLEQRVTELEDIVRGGK